MAEVVVSFAKDWVVGKLLDSVSDAAVFSMNMIRDVDDATQIAKANARHCLELADACRDMHNVLDRAKPKGQPFNDNVKPDEIFVQTLQDVHKTFQQVQNIVDQMKKKPTFTDRVSTIFTAESVADDIKRLASSLQTSILLFNTYLVADIRSRQLGDDLVIRGIEQGLASMKSLQQAPASADLAPALLGRAPQSLPYPAELAGAISAPSALPHIEATPQHAPTGPSQGQYPQFPSMQYTAVQSYSQCPQQPQMPPQHAQPPMTQYPQLPPVQYPQLLPVQPTPQYPPALPSQVPAGSYPEMQPGMQPQQLSVPQYPPVLPPQHAQVPAGQYPEMQPGMQPQQWPVPQHPLTLPPQHAQVPAGSYPNMPPQFPSMMQPQWPPQCS